STISLLEVPVAYLIDERRVNRKKIVWGVAGFTFLVGIPSALSQGASDFWSNVGPLPEKLAGGADVLSQMSFVFGSISLTLGALLMSIFVGWVWGTKRAGDELEQGSNFFAATRGFWAFMIRFFIPAVIVIIFLNLFGIFN
ncbi:MAG: sodium-dependent transporter, partial [Candidatus Krumholzibacteria bacterium]|nr:sodium-dependent transporter [Candidatus Krumholzibacteria bacterium]